MKTETTNTLDAAGAAVPGAMQPRTGKVGAGIVDKYLIRVGGHAIFFHNNMHCRKCAETVKDERASKFDSIVDATNKAIEHGLTMFAPEKSKPTTKERK